MTEFQYETLGADQVASIGEQATTATEPTLDYAALLPAWEADHAAHVALRDAAETDEDKAPHVEAIATLEAAILEARSKVTA
jgi:hypothetical protein